MHDPHPDPHDHRSYGPPRGQWRVAPTRTAPPPSSMRVSDAERTEVTNALCRHLGDGRLDEAEFNDRVARATAAKTRADLAPLLTDLPPLDTGARNQPPPSVPRRRRPVMWLVIVALAVTALGWGVTGTIAHVFDPHIPWLFIGILAVVFLRGGRHRHRRHHHHHF